MADIYIPKNPAALHAPGPQKPPAEAAKEAVQTATFASDMEAATAFQKHLDKGYQGMLEVWQTLPPEIQAVAGDPSAQSASQDAQLDWYFKVNEAVTKQQAMSQAASGDYAGADATAIAGPATPDTRKALGGFTADRKAEGLAKQVGDFAQSLGTSGSQAYGAADLSPKSKFGRSMKITQARLQPLAADISAMASQHGVPESLIRAVITRESTGNAQAQPKDKDGNLRSSAKGLMQLIDATAGRFGVTDAFDPKQNISGGTQYLKFLIDRYGDVEKAVAAYHEGEGRMDSLLQEKGEAWREGLSDDAKAYVPDVMKLFQAYGGGEVKTKPQGAGSMEKLVADMLKQNPQMINTPEGKALADAVQFDIMTRRGELKEEAKGGRLGATLDMREKEFKARQKNQLSKRLEGTEIPSIANIIKDVDTALKDQGGLGGDNASLPGTGYLDKILDPRLREAKANEINSLLTRLYSLELKRISGVAVSDQEYQRYAETFANNGKFSAKEQMQALRAYVRAFHSIVDNIRLGFDEDVWAEVGGKQGLDDLPVPKGVLGGAYTSPQPGGKAPAAEAPAGAPKAMDAASRKARLAEIARRKAELQGTAKK